MEQFIISISIDELNKSGFTPIAYDELSNDEKLLLPHKLYSVKEFVNEVNAGFMGDLDPEENIFTYIGGQYGR